MFSDDDEKPVLDLFDIFLNYFLFVAGSDIAGYWLD
jgi:hypothetical protein